MQITMSNENRTAHKTLIYGPEGIGKTWWAADAEDPIFLDSDNGMQELDPPRQRVACTCTQDAFDFVKEFPKDRKTAVIDTVDAMAEIFADEICVQEEWEAILDPGWAKGTDKVKAVMKRFLKAIDALQVLRPEVQVIFLGHSMIKNFINPRGLDYCKYMLKMFASSADILKASCDNVLFACYEETGAKEPGKKTAKGAGSSEPVVYTRHRPAWDAKNRRQLDFKMPLKYAEFNKFSKPVFPSTEGIKTRYDEQEAEDMEREPVVTLADVKKMLRARLDSKKDDGWTMNTMKQRYFKPAGVVDLSAASPGELADIAKLVQDDIDDE